MKILAMDDFYKYRFLSGITYAPAGKAAAFVAAQACPEDNTYQSHIWVYEAGKMRRLTGLGQENSFVWQDDEHLLFTARRTESEKKRAQAGEQFTAYYRIPLHGGEAEKAFELPCAMGALRQVAGSLYVGAATIDAACPDYYKLPKKQRAQTEKERADSADYEVFDEVPFWANGGGFTNKKRTALFWVDVTSGRLGRVTAPLFDLQAVAILGGKVYYAGEEYNTKPTQRQDIFVYDPASGKVRCVYNRREADIAGLEAAGGRLVVVASTEERYGINENSWFYVLDEEQGALRLLRKNEESLWGSVGSDCRYGGGRSLKGTQEGLYFITTRRNSACLYRLEADGRETPVLTREGSADCFDIAPDGKSALLVGMYGMQLQELYELNLATGRLRQVSRFNRGALQNVYVAQPQKLTILSQGAEIDGWVLPPAGYDPAQKYPAILDIHGGPKTVYGEVFYHEMQYWAGQGYFVLFCNPTGSDGRGNEFADIRGKYGTVDYENIMDFTDAVLAAWPAIDPGRVAVTGGSYGGFMTNWIIGHTGRFACAASQRSISNWVSFTGMADIGLWFGPDQTGGDIGAKVEKMWWHSPLKYAASVTTPTLFIHSDEDYRCPMAEGLQMYTALVDQGVPARLCYFKGENHELSRSGRPKHRLRRLQEITQWAEHYTR